MHRMTRVATLMALVLLLAACTGSGVGLGGSPAPSTAASSGDASAMPSATADAGEDSPDRVDMSTLAADPGSYLGQEIRVLARIDEVVSDGGAFLTSPSGTADGQLAVIIMPDATVGAEIAQRDVVWVEGTVVGVSAEDLHDAGVDLTPADLGGYTGEYAIIASDISDPFGG